MSSNIKSNHMLQTVLDVNYILKNHILVTVQDVN